MCKSAVITYVISFILHYKMKMFGTIYDLCCNTVIYNHYIRKPHFGPNGIITISQEAVICSFGSYETRSEKRDFIVFFVQRKTLIVGNPV